MLANEDVRLAYVAAGEVSPLYRNAGGDECIYVESGVGTIETVFGPLDVGAGRLRDRPPFDDAPLDPRRRRAAARLLHRGRQPPLAAAHATCPRTASCSSTRRTASATCAVPTEPAAVDESDVEVYVSHRDGRGTVGTIYTYRRPSVRRRRLGRLPLPLRVQHPRLRAVHEGHPPAASGRTRCSRAAGSSSATSCRARSTTTRCRARPLLPLQRRQRRGDLLLRAATTPLAADRGSVPARSRCTPPATPTGPSPARTKRSIGTEQVGRAGGDGRHLPLPRARGGGRRLRGSRLRVDLGGPNLIAGPSLRSRR